MSTLLPPINTRATVARDGRTYSGVVIRHGQTREGLPTVTVEYRVPGGRGATARATGIIGFDTVRW